jgi:hypothetical protein
MIRAASMPGDGEMRTTTAGLLALTAALLGGCAMHGHGPGHHAQMAEQLYRMPLVTVKAGLISVSPEPLVLRRSEAADEIVWVLPPGLTFQKNGIQIDGLLLGGNGEPLAPRQDAHVGVAAKPDPRSAGHFRCEPRGERQFACKLDKKQSRPGIYKYTIRLMQDGKALPPADPHIYHPD